MLTKTWGQLHPQFYNPGSLAAAIQSALYSGATAGVFSAAQSFAMTTVAASPAAIAAACGAISGGALMLRDAAAQNLKLAKL